MAERYVRYFKSQLKKMEKGEGTLQDKVSRILLTYRCTPHATTTESPAYLLMRRQLRTRFSSLRPSLDSQKDAETFEQNTSCLPKFAVGDKVYVLNLRAVPRWLPGIVIEVLQRSYYVHVDGQPVWKRHEDQLRPRSMQCKSEGSIPTPPTVVPVLERHPGVTPTGTAPQRLPETPSRTEESTNGPPETNRRSAESTSQTPQVNPHVAASTPKATEPKPTVATAPTASVPRRNPPRERKPPSRYGWE
ncbi:uncharacterized protein LOC116294667 [Actinia tenebrosa]|uniref:Uncharacterized protein LOC116294667 n=1 Tax=Actinia tenebrosa TaxID=6105 RepID=A0A6P8HSJ2_ACTTE|nr:uncharacterized protein LOC116294667 [Actinia tenebrosa]